MLYKKSTRSLPTTTMTTTMKMATPTRRNNYIWLVSLTITTVLVLCSQTTNAAPTKTSQAEVSSPKRFIDCNKCVIVFSIASPTQRHDTNVRVLDTIYYNVFYVTLWLEYSGQSACYS